MLDLLDALLAILEVAGSIPTKKRTTLKGAYARRREEKMRREGHPPTGFWGLDEGHDV